MGLQDFLALLLGVIELSVHSRLLEDLAPSAALIFIRLSLVVGLVSYKEGSLWLVRLRVSTMVTSGSL